MRQKQTEEIAILLLRSSMQRRKKQMQLKKKNSERRTTSDGCRLLAESFHCLMLRSYWEPELKSLRKRSCLGPGVVA